MKPGARPFGVTLLVAYAPSVNVPEDGGDSPAGIDALLPRHEKPHLYRIDPSGSVVSLGDSHCVINGNFNADFLTKLKDFARSTTKNSIDVDHSLLTQMIVDALDDQVKMREETISTIPTRMAIICASLTVDRGLVIQRHDKDSFL